MNHDAPSYGLWILVAINSLVFILFAFSFTHPRTGRDWRSFGAFSAFIVALFAEMYGFPLTIYLLSGWLSSQYPGLDLYGHNSGHLWHSLLGLKGDPHFDVFHILSNVFIFGGFILLSASWRVLYKAQAEHQLAITGPYTPVLAKHTKNFGLQDSLSIGVDRMQRNFEPMRRQVETWRTRQLSDEVAKLIIYSPMLFGAK